MATLLLIFCLVGLLYHEGSSAKAQFPEDLNEEAMKKYGELYGFPYDATRKNHDGVLPNRGGNLPNSASQNGNLAGNQGGQQPWPGQGGGNAGQETWPGQGQVGQGQDTWPDEDRDGWPDPWQGQGWPDQNSKEDPDEVRRLQNKNPGSSNTPEEPRAGAVGHRGNSKSNQSNAANMDPDRKSNQQQAKFDPSHPRAPIPKAQYQVKMFNGSITARHPCHLHPGSAEIHHDIGNKVSNGAKLIKFNILFPEYHRGDVERIKGYPTPDNPLNYNLTGSFKANIWQRTYSKHGRTLLALAFNYDILSLKMLQFGVEEMNINVVDAPLGCFQFLSEEERIQIAMDLVLANFDFKEEFEPYLGLTEDDSACYRIIKDVDGYGEFRHQCCGIDPKTGKLECTEELAIEWIDTMYILIAGVKIISLLFAPLFLQWIAYSASIKKTDYVVRLKDFLMKTLLVKRQRAPSDQSANKESRQFAKFKRIVKSVPSDEIVHVQFR